MYRLSLKGITAVLTLFAAASPLAAQEVVLRYSNWVPATHPIITEAIEPLARDLEAATEGRVTIEVMPALGPPVGHFDLVANDVADMAFSVHSYTPGRFLLTELGELPFTHNNALVNSLAYWNTYQRFFMEADEHAGVRLLGLWTNGPFQLAMRGEHLSSIDALEGRRIRVPGPLVEQVTTALGMVPISSTVADAYEQISRGVINGMFQQLETTWNFGLTEYLTQISIVPGGFAHSSQYVVMSETAYQRLTDQDREALDALTGEALVRRFAEMWQAQEDAAVEPLLAAGVTLFEVPEPVVAELQEALAFIEADWIEAASARGVDAIAALEFYRAEIDRIAEELGVQ